MKASTRKFKKRKKDRAQVCPPPFCRAVCFTRSTGREDIFCASQLHDLFFPPGSPWEEVLPFRVRKTVNETWQRSMAAKSGGMLLTGRQQLRHRLALHIRLHNFNGPPKDELEHFRPRHLCFTSSMLFVYSCFHQSLTQPYRPFQISSSSSSNQTACSSGQCFGTHMALHQYSFKRRYWIW